ncbi:hypothetical protein M407DRAFT_84399, partial [Tulasnella calospora MUT 4182]
MYRDLSAPREKPSEYYIRKLKLLHTAESYTETELILAIMEGAPKYWHLVIDTSTLLHTVDLQDKIIYHEDALMYGPGSSSDGFERLEKSHAHLVGFHKDLGKPLFPRDDKTLAKGKSPEEKGARPCQHCGSSKHWDNECRY